MVLPIVGTLIEAGLKIIDRVLPDPQQKAQAQIELLKLQQAGEFKQLEIDAQALQAQADINKLEATSGNWFVASWRPLMGYMCVLIFGANYIGAPALAWLSGIYGWPPPPRLDIGEVLPVLMGMLGLGSLRTVEKTKGVA